MSDMRVDHGATPPKPGTRAPDLELPSTPDQKVSLAELRGQPVILAFHPERAAVDAGGSSTRPA